MSQSPLILGLESTCDETGAAVVRGGRRVLSNVVATQFDLHRKFRGVVPEIASRAHIENLLPVLKESLSQAQLSLADLDAISVTHRPGLIGSLLVGVTAAKTLAWALNKPLIAVDHVQSHLYSVELAEDTEAPREPVPFPAVGLVVSGGHTALYAMRSFIDLDRVGSTIDDAIGEAYDKVAAILDLPYPGGPVVDRLAAQGTPVIRFPRTLLEKDSLDFSFSGLKTSVLYHVQGNPSKKRNPEKEPPGPARSTVEDVCASFQQACVEIVLEKLRRAIRQTNARSVIIGGGVSANRGLRQALSQFELPVYLPPLKYCTDNAAMSAGLACLSYQKGDFAPLSLDAVAYSAIAAG